MKLHLTPYQISPIALRCPEQLSGHTGTNAPIEMHLARGVCVCVCVCVCDSCLVAHDASEGLITHPIRSSQLEPQGIY